MTQSATNSTQPADGTERSKRMIIFGYFWAKTATNCTGFPWWIQVFQFLEDILFLSNWLNSDSMTRDFVHSFLLDFKLRSSLRPLQISNKRSAPKMEEPAASIKTQDSCCFADPWILDASCGLFGSVVTNGVLKSTLVEHYLETTWNHDIWRWKPWMNRDEFDSNFDPKQAVNFQHLPQPRDRGEGRHCNAQGAHSGEAKSWGKAK